MKKILTAVLFLCLLFSHGARAEETQAEAFVFGRSALGRDLVCLRVGPEDAENRFLLVFGVHGYEDRFVRDGALLKETAEKLAALLAAEPELPALCSVYIVPCANPDGLLDGTSNVSFGRLNAEGLDINRDFPEGWIRRTAAANRTGDAPFASCEARALRDLVLSVSPRWAADVHGYVNRVKYASNRTMAAYFASRDALDMPFEKWQSGGMLCAWLDTLTDGALLIELPNPLKNGNVNVLKDGYTADMARRLFLAVTGWLRENPVPAE